MIARLLVVLACGAFVVSGAAVPAGAAEDRPECEGNMSPYATAGGHSTAVAAVIPLTAGTDPAAYPVSAVVTCSIVVDGSVAWSRSTNAIGVAVLAAATQVPFSPNGYTLCTTIDYTSIDRATDSWCSVRQWRKEPWDTYNDVVRATELVWSRANEVIVRHVDPHVCPVLGRLAPGTDMLTITPEGDVYVLGNQWWDCPPYAS